MLIIFTDKEIDPIIFENKIDSKLDAEDFPLFAKKKILVKIQNLEENFKMGVKELQEKIPVLEDKYPLSILIYKLTDKFGYIDLEIFLNKRSLDEYVKETYRFLKILLETMKSEGIKSFLRCTYPEDIDTSTKDSIYIGNIKKIETSEIEDKDFYFDRAFIYEVI
jgi:hypothetical protein